MHIGYPLEGQKVGDFYEELDMSENIILKWYDLRFSLR
jgi:hypothetical protein